PPPNSDRRVRRWPGTAIERGKVPLPTSHVHPPRQPRGERERENERDDSDKDRRHSSPPTPRYSCRSWRSSRVRKYAVSGRTASWRIRSNRAIVADGDGGIGNS